MTSQPCVTRWAGHPEYDVTTLCELVYGTPEWDKWPAVNVARHSSLCRGGREVLCPTCWRVLKGRVPSLPTNNPRRSPTREDSGGDGIYKQNEGKEKEGRPRQRAGRRHKRPFSYKEQIARTCPLQKVGERKTEERKKHLQCRK